jgi:hypothetical protein
MAGYFGGKTEFKDSLAKLVAEIARIAGSSMSKPAVSYVFTRDAGQPFEPFNGPPQDLITAILNNNVLLGGSSMLQDALRQIKDDLAPDQVDLLITDGIVSYPNEQVQRDREVNRTSIEALGAQVQLVFQDPDWAAKKKIQPAVAVLQYLSRFQGTYYTYRNDKLACCPAPRPYYIWIIGEARRVTALFAAIQRTSGFAPRHAVVLGGGGLDAQPRVLTYTKRVGTWRRDRTDRLRVRRVPADGQAQATVALNLRGLSDDVLTREHVLKHVAVSADFATVVPVDFASRAQLEATLDPNDGPDLQDATHFLTLGVRELRAGATIASVELRDELPAWCRAATTDDDTNAAEPESRPATFGFLPVLSGAARALRKSGILVQFQLALEQ